MRKIVKLLGISLLCVLGIVLVGFWQVDAQNITKTYKLNGGNTLYMEYYSDDTAFVRGTGAISRYYWDTCREAIKDSVQEINFEQGIQAPSYCEEMFMGMSALKSVDLSTLDTSMAQTMYSMFEGCLSLENANLSNLDTSNVESMLEMFKGCSSLKTLNLSGFDTGSVYDMSNMFEGCLALETVDLSSFDTSTCENMQRMFYRCSGLTELDLSSFRTGNVTDMSYMFAYCTSLEAVNVSSFDTSRVDTFASMFYECKSLLSLDISNFNTRNATTIVDLFDKCSSLTYLDLSNLVTSNAQFLGSWFDGCTNLKYVDISGYEANQNKVMGYIGIFNSNNVSLDTIVVPQKKHLLNDTLPGDFYNSSDPTDDTIYDNLKGLSGGIVLKRVTEFQVMQTNKTVEYDGNEHAIVVDVLNAQNYTIKYKNPNSGQYTDDTCAYKNVGEYVVEYMIQERGYLNYYGTGILKITEKPQMDASLKLDSYSATVSYPKVREISFNITENTSNGVLSVVSLDETKATVALNGNKVTVTILNEGAVTIRVSTGATKEYKEASATYNLRISPAAYTYHVIYQSATGVELGKDEVTNLYGTTNEIPPRSFDGYIAPSSKMVAWDSADAKDIIFVYEPITYIITLDPNNGTPVYRREYTIETDTFVLENPMKTGHVFIGWSKDLNETPVERVEIKKGSTGDLNYIANWDTDFCTYNVIFKSGTGLTLSETTVTKRFGTTQEIVPSDVSGYITPEKQVIEWNSIKAKDIVFVYEPITYTITIYPNNGEEVYTKDYTVETETFVLENPKKTGYTFKGWSTASRAGLLEKIEIKKGTVGNFSYVANWSVNRYTYNVILETSTGLILNETTVSKSYGTTQEMIPSAVTGYKTPEKQIVEWDSTQGKRISFVYEPIVYTVTIYMNDGTPAINKEYTIETESFALEAPSREGYTFVGWTKNDEIHPTKVVEIVKGTIGDVTYTANWSENLPEIKDTGNGINILTVIVMILFLTEMCLLIIPISQKLEK